VGDIDLLDLAASSGPRCSSTTSTTCARPAGRPSSLGDGVAMPPRRSSAAPWPPGR